MSSLLETQVFAYAKKKKDADQLRGNREADKPLFSLHR